MKTRKFKPNPITWYGSVDVFSVCAHGLAGSYRNLAGSKETASPNFIYDFFTKEAKNSTE
jgi:hypothetical protein